MKPRAFVGSSVEGLHVAYAVQQNLLHDLEVTVWDQGVFELSGTTIESLTKAIASADFGIFIFSPDDMLKMRSDEVTSVRDNVLFELGLFIGKLGRDRVFFLVPATSPPHIPSDLIGITPAKYDNERSDGSMQAATGPACHQMRLLINKLGPIIAIDSDLSKPRDSGETSSNKRGWLVDFFAGKYTEAKAALEAVISEKAGEEALEESAWIHYCNLKLDSSDALQKLLDFASDNRESAIAQKLVAAILRNEHETDRAIELLQSASVTLLNNPVIKIALSACYMANLEHEKAIALLEERLAVADPDVALALAEIYEGQENLGEALAVVHDAYIRNPRHRELRFKYARLSQDVGKNDIALYLLDGLSSEFPESVDDWGYLGNACLSLGLNDRALFSYRKAESLIKAPEGGSWIHGNIGNLFTNRELPSEAIGYFERALIIDPDSEYAHDRLASALKNRDKKCAEFKKKADEGFKSIRAMAAERRKVD